MSKSLVIVESPAKARTLNKYLGKNYSVKASVGHIIDLPQKTFGVKIDNGFEPEWVVVPGKKKVIDELKKAAQGADEVFIASDPDREGEAIAWHVAEIVRKANPNSPVHRVLVNEITKRGVEDAMAHPGELNENLFNAQQARRILDRIMGYKLSPLLQRKVRKGLSAGRVQSVAVRLICEREQAVASFVPEEYWTIEVTLDAGQPPIFIARLIEIDGEKAKIGSEKDASRIVAELAKGGYAVRDIQRKERKRNPAPPFTTAKLQQEASRKLRFTAKQTMAFAQKLYEGVEVGEQGPVGLITYMRTDSVRVSTEAQEAARGVIASRFGNDFLPPSPPVYKSKKDAQEAHEAIRPTDMNITPEEASKHLDREMARLYELIYLRFLASQMKPAVYDQIQINIVNGRFLLRTTAQTIKFAGFTAAYTEGTDEGTVENGENSAGKFSDLPTLKEGQPLKSEKITPEQHFTQPPPRFTEATLVKELEELGIGRPSTYAQILSTIQDRDYAGKQDGKFFPTELGCLVNELLVASFPDILNVAFTAQMEDDLDKIEEGKLDWRVALSDFWNPFSKKLEEAQTGMRNVKKEREEITDIPCSTCGKPMAVKWGRKGEFLACSGFPKCKNTSNFRRDENGKVQPLTNGVKTPCPLCGKPLLVRSGRKGDFIGCSGYPECSYTTDFTRDENGEPVPVEKAKAADQPSQEAGEEEAQTCPSCGKPMVKKSGRWGPYFSCTGFPECKQTVRIKVARQAPVPTDITCDKCGKPMVIRAGRRGEFLACSGYPKCRNAKNFTKDESGKITVAVEQTTDEKCDKCGKPMAIKKGRWGPFLACTGYPECSNIKKMKKP